jgi:uncharacterized protein (TIGR02466 family)
MKIDTIFTQTIAHKILSVDNESITKFCYELRGRDPEGRVLSNSGGWQSKEFYPPVNVLTELLSQIDDCMSQYCRLYSFNFQPRIGNIWVNINKHSNHNSSHDHPGSIISAVYYVKVPDNSGHIQFLTPVQKYEEYLDGDIIQEYNPINSGTFDLYPREKQLILFPSWLYHKVYPNQTEDDRISIAINYVR